jgi:hypothetical protein
VSNSNDLKKKGNQIKTLLHELYRRHIELHERFKEFIQRGGKAKMMKGNAHIIQIHGLEFYAFKNVEKPQFIKDDVVSLLLPESLQPGWSELRAHSRCECLHSPILPLARALGGPKTIRVMSALLCQVRIIFISKDIEKLSACVRGAAAILAQGLLEWKHVQIPVVPPHLFNFLTERKKPYLVGVLMKFAHRLKELNMLNVLCINIDTNDFSTLHMANHQIEIPDLLQVHEKKWKKKTDYSPEILSKDICDIIEEDRKIWGLESDTQRKETDNTGSKSTVSRITVTKEENQVDCRNKQFFDAAAFLGTLLRSTTLSDTDGEQKINIIDNESSANSDSAPESLSLDDQFSHQSNVSVDIEPYFDNERGEEMIRASLTSFFLDLFGDMG